MFFSSQSMVLCMHTRTLWERSWWYMQKSKQASESSFWDFKLSWVGHTYRGIFSEWMWERLRDSMQIYEGRGLKLVCREIEKRREGKMKIFNGTVNSRIKWQGLKINIFILLTFFNFYLFCLILIWLGDYCGSHMTTEICQFMMKIFMIC